MALLRVRNLARRAGRNIGDLPSRCMAFLADSRGVSTVEYALLTLAVVIVVGAGAVTMGGAFEGLFENLETELTEEQTEIEKLGEEQTE